MITLNMATAQEINWMSEVQAEEAFEIKQKPIFILYSADWCRNCKKIKKFLNKNAEKLNKKMYFVNIDCTDEENCEGLKLYPTSYIMETDGSTIRIEGQTSKKIINAILELN